METVRMTWARLTGEPLVERRSEDWVLTAKYPNPEIGTLLVKILGVLILGALIVVPIGYYAEFDVAPTYEDNLLAVLFAGLIGAAAPILEVFRDWTPGNEMPDLSGFGYGIAVAIIILICGGGTLIFWKEIRDRPYLRVRVDKEALSIQRGRFGSAKEIPLTDIVGVEVGRRLSGAYEVLIQHQDLITPVAIVAGNECRAILLKAKIEAMLSNVQYEAKS